MFNLDYYNCLFQIMLCTRHFGSMGLAHSFNTTRRCLLGSIQYYLPRSTHLFRLSHLPRFIQYRSQYLPNSSVRKARTPVSASLIIIIICFRKQCSHISNSGLLRQPQLMIVQRLVKCLYSALIINPRRKAQAEGYCNRLAIFVCPSVRPSVRPSQPSFAKW